MEMYRMMLEDNVVNQLLAQVVANIFPANFADMNPNLTSSILSLHFRKSNL